MLYRVQTNDDGTLSIVTDGDCIAHSDPNHGKGDVADKRNFAVMCAALNSAHAIEQYMEWQFSRKPFRFD